MYDHNEPVNIEEIVGRKRHPTLHYARIVSEERHLYVMHSQECIDSGIDFSTCKFSLGDVADTMLWRLPRDVPAVFVEDGDVRINLYAEDAVDVDHQ